MHYKTTAALVCFAQREGCVLICNVTASRNFSTSSSAVAERPRDALCPSVVSLNNITTRAEFLIIVT